MPTAKKADAPDELGYAAARIFKYYRQFANSRIVNALPERRITARSLYKSYKDAFNRVSAFFSSHNLDIRRYLKFMATDVCVNDQDIKQTLASRRGLRMFAEKLSAEENNRKVHEWYSRTVKTLAEECLDSECVSTADFIRNLIREKKLAAWVVCGKISAYYLAAIPRFPKIIDRLDPISRSSLLFISDRYDMYNTAANKAQLAFENRKANPIRDTDQMIESIRAERRSKRVSADDIFDPAQDS